MNRINKVKLCLENEINNKLIEIHTKVREGGRLFWWKFVNKVEILISAIVMSYINKMIRDE